MWWARKTTSTPVMWRALHGFTLRRMAYLVLESILRYCELEMDFFAIQSLTSKVFFFIDLLRRAGLFLLKEDILSLLDSRRMFCGCNFWIIWNDLVVESSQRFYHGNGYFPGNKSISPSSQCGVGNYPFSLGGICFHVPWRVVFGVHSVSQAERAVSILKGLGEKCC